MAKTILHSFFETLCIFILFTFIRRRDCRADQSNYRWRLQKASCVIRSIAEESESTDEDEAPETTAETVVSQCPFNDPTTTMTTSHGE